MKNLIGEMGAPVFGNIDQPGFGEIPIGGYFDDMGFPGFGDIHQPGYCGMNTGGVIGTTHTGGLKAI